MPCNSMMSSVRVIWLMSCATAALGATVMVAIAERVRVPLVPVIVTGKDALGVEALVVMVSTEFPGAIVEVGAKVAVAPDGKSETLQATVPVKPFWAVRFTV